MRSGISLFPNAITAGNMALGIYSITASIDQKWSQAAWCILGGIVLDMLDGRVARWTNSCSRFGVEFDSFSDLITFGVAPALMMYVLVLNDFGRIGFAISLLYILCAALRLARFNVKAQETEEAKSYFVGLPTPAAGGILASFVVLYDIWAAGKKARTIHLVMNQVPAFYHLLPAIVFALSVLMVSNLRYSSFKKMNLIRARSMRAFLSIILVLLMIYMYPQNAIFVIFVGYICSGILELLWRSIRIRKSSSDFKVETPNGDSWDIKKRDII